LEPRPTGSRGRLVGIAALGTLMTLSAVAVVHSQECRASVLRTEKAAADLTHLSHERIERGRMALDLLVAFFRSSDEVTAAEFEQFATHVLHSDFCVLWIAWRPVETNRGPALVSPKNQAAAMQGATQELKFSTDSDSIAEVCGHGPDTILLLRQNVFAPGTENGRRPGEALIAIDTAAALSHPPDQAAARGLELVLRIADGPSPPIVVQRIHAPGTNKEPAQSQDVTAIGTPDHFEFGGRSFEVACNRRAGGLDTPTPLTWVTLAIGTLATWWVIHGFSSVQRRHHYAEQLVAERTQQLAEANHVLDLRVAERTAELEQAHRELESFSFSVSHDLRAPLRAIDGFAGMLEEDHTAALDADAQRLLGVIRSSSRDMSALIDALLRLSRLGRHALERTSVDVQAMVESILAEIRAATPDLRAQVTIGRLGTVHADATLLREVFRNLIGNAVKFSDKASTPTVSIQRSDADAAPTFTIQDNGAGFDPAFADKLFTPFQRLHRADEFEGSGIGLALCQRIVAMHGGHIEAHGEPGAGATLRFDLGATSRSQP
jgi:signal transduction histidine kinase